jgi:hypothetical protein
MIRKYPRTRHVVGSRLQPGDEDLASVGLSELLGRHVVVEEKMDGANCALSFSSEAELRLQSRGHFLTGGPRERHFDLFKQWARAHEDQLFDAIGDQYVVYGEWLHAKHTVFYDALPHYFMEFDVLDLESDAFLDTARRSDFLKDLPIVAVKVLFEGVLEDERQLWSLVGASHFITPNAREVLRETAERLRLDPQQVAAETDLSGLMEGLYIKIEEDGVVQERLKIVRKDFVTQILESERHWMERPIVPNQLRADADLFSTEAKVS